MATEGLTPDDADQMRDFADRCRRVEATASRTASAETAEASALLVRAAHCASELRAALLAAANHADPEGADDD